MTKLVFFLMLAFQAIRPPAGPPACSSGLTKPRLFYEDLAMQPIVPISSGELEREGMVIDVPKVQYLKGLLSILRTSTDRDYWYPSDVRLELRTGSRDPLYVGSDGEITEGHRSWQLSPAAYLQLYLELRNLERFRTVRARG